MAARIGLSAATVASAQPAPAVFATVKEFTVCRVPLDIHFALSGFIAAKFHGSPTSINTCHYHFFET
jgi:hypothetical protein